MAAPIEARLLANQKALDAASNAMHEGRKKIHAISLSGANPTAADWAEQTALDTRVFELIKESQVLIDEYMNS